MKPWSVSADWVLTGTGRCLHRGVIRGRGKTIEAVGYAPSVPEADDRRRLAGAAILPGLINAHTHLELTHLLGKLPPRRPMVQWLFALLCEQATAEIQAESVARGAQQALAAGTTTVADVCHDNQAWRVLRSSPIRRVCFAEVSGIGPIAGQAMGQLRDRLLDLHPDDRTRFGIAPHAPYSTAENVYQQAVELARQLGWPVCTHLAEGPAERQFLLRGTGKFFEFLSRLGLIDLSVPVHGCTSMAFAKRVGLLDAPSILVHVNHADREEFELLAASDASVVYCPRCNDFFGRGGHRYVEMLAAGVNVALGTDSLASNVSLEILDEMRRVRAEGRVDNQTILRMATLNGARALAWDDEIGSLEPGKQADWIAVPAGPEGHDPLEAILTTDAAVLETTIAGERVYARNEVAAAEA